MLESSISFKFIINLRIFDRFKDKNMLKLLREFARSRGSNFALLVSNTLGLISATVRKQLTNPLVRVLCGVLEKGGQRGVNEKEGGSVGGSVSKLGEDTSSNVAKNNVGQCCTAAPNEGNVLINVIDSPATNSYLMLLGPTSYAKLVIGESSKKSMNFCTLIVPAGNGADVAFSEDGLSAIGTKLGTPLMLDSYTSDMCIQSWGMSSYARAVIEFRADVELKNTIVVAMSKLVFGHVLDECPKNIRSNVVKNLKTHRQLARVPALVVKKQAELSSQKVSNANPFDALNSIEDGDDMGTNGENSKLAGKESLNVGHGSFNNTPIIEKIDKLERQILDGKLTFVDDDGKPLYKVVTKGNEDSESEVEVMFYEIANLMASTSLKGGSDRGYGINSMLEQWRETG
ncbi:hypothetical protein Tco_0167979 [Tanacetum coccineum]